MLGAVFQKAGQLLAGFGGQGGGRQRRDGSVEKPQAQVQRPAREDHACEGIGRVAGASQLGRHELAELTERGPLLGRNLDGRRLARSNPPSRVATVVLQTGVDFGQALHKDLARVPRPDQGVDDDNGEAGDQEVQAISDVEADRVPHGPLEKHKEAQGGHHRGQGRRQGNQLLKSKPVKIHSSVTAR